MAGTISSQAHESLSEVSYQFMGNYLSVEKRKRIFHLLCEGNGIRSIMRLVGCTGNTILQLRKRYCAIIEFINKQYFTQLEIDEIEADEIRTYILHKTNLRWIFIAMDRKSRCILHFHIGDRDTESAREFIVGLGRKLKSEFVISTDNLLSYQAAVAKNEYGRKEADIRNAKVLRGENFGFPYGRAITNRMERANGTIRQHVSSLIRKTKCFAKKEEGMRHHLTLFFFYYNFIKISKAVKVPPAVAAGITDEANWEDKILEYDLLFSEKMANKNPKAYGILDVGSKKISSIGDLEKEMFIDDLAAVPGFEKDSKKRGTYKKAAKVIKMVS